LGLRQTHHRHKEKINMNNYKATGRLTEDPELRELPTGTPVCKLTVAVKSLAREGEVGYIDVSSFGASGEAAARVLTKGWLVALDGRLEYHDWETQDGEKRRSWELIGNVEFLAAPKSANSESSQEPAAAAA
jgi:single-strand DNA-binding protein